MTPLHSTHTHLAHWKGLIIYFWLEPKPFYRHSLCTFLHIVHVSFRTTLRRHTLLSHYIQHKIGERVRKKRFCTFAKAKWFKERKKNVWKKRQPNVLSFDFVWCGWMVVIADVIRHMLNAPYFRWMHWFHNRWSSSCCCDRKIFK